MIDGRPRYVTAPGETERDQDPFSCLDFFGTGLDPCEAIQ
jgi:hypothetical protein